MSSWALRSPAASGAAAEGLAGPVRMEWARCVSADVVQLTEKYKHQAGTPDTSVTCRLISSVGCSCIIHFVRNMFKHIFSRSVLFILTHKAHIDSLHLGLPGRVPF